MRTEKLKLKVIAGLTASSLGLGLVTSLHAAADNQYDSSAAQQQGKTGQAGPIREAE